MPDEGVRFFVIGGGYSLKGFDFSKLDGYKIGANKSAIVANADCLVSMDGNYARQARKDLLEFKGEIILALLRPDQEKNRIPNAIYLRSDRGTGVTKDVDRVVGLNSGYAALDVAYKKGAKDIALLGFDMKMGPEKHFHGGYLWDTGKGNYKGWARRFDIVAKMFEKRGIRCINYIGPEGSELNQFETRPLEELQ